MNRYDDWYTRLSVKFANYSSYGLPVLTNEWVGEVSRLINKYNLVPSVIYHDKYFEPNSPTKIQKERIRKWALNYFSGENINKFI